MKKFFSFFIKEFKHILRDRRTMMILFGIPVLQILMFGFALTTEVNHVKLAVLIPQENVEARRLVDRIDATKVFDIVARVYNNDEINKMLRENRINAALVFGNDFEKDIRNGSANLQAIIDGSDPNTARTIATYLQSAVQNSSDRNLTLSLETRQLYNPQAKSAYNFVPGVMGLVLMLICAMMTSVSIVRENELGSIELLLVSPTNRFLVIFCKILPYFTLSCVDLALILLISVFALGVPIAGSLVLLLFVSLLYILVALSLGLLISTIASTQVQALLMSGMMLMMPTMLLSGMIYPVESMPLFFQYLSSIIPARWYIEAVRKTMIEGVGIMFIWKNILAMLLMALVLVTVSLKKLRVRLD